jgi:phosphoglucomutase
MHVDPRAGKPADQSMLANIPRLVSEYYTRQPDPARRDERVSFGTSGHRGSSRNGAFNERHILAITQAICDYRARQGIDGPVFLGIDTHALSESAYGSALEVLAANDVPTMIDSRDGFTPTPRFLATTGRARREGGSRTASSSRRRTIRPRTEASSTTRPTVAPPTPP